jgi:D-apionolactonase
MKQFKVPTAIALCGTEQPDVVGRTLTAGPMSVELDNGQLRYLKVNGVEVLRAVAFLVRDENWGTYVPTLSDLKVEQRKDGFSVSYHAACKKGAQEIVYDATITGRADGSLEFNGTATPKTDFLTARTGFVVLHPLSGVVGNAVEVEHVDRKLEKSKFPELVNPIQPFLHIRSLTHEFTPGIKAIVRFDGDTWEMEDHRNWTDASFKTYVRPLALPWPYTLKAGEQVKQSVTVTLSGSAAKNAKGSAAKAIEVKLGAPTRSSLQPVGLGMPAEEIDHAVKRLDLLKRAAPRFLQCQFDPREKHGAKELYGYRVLCEQTGADCVLEVVVESLDDYKGELARLAALVKDSGLKLAAIAVCPVGDLKSVLPGGPRPPAPPLEDLYAAARAAFPGVRLGGGMFSFFTELNRKHPPAKLLDFVMNTTCPIVHAADDRSVMETLEALPYQVTTARSFIGKTAYRIGPSGIGARDNPHGKTYTPNPNNERVCLPKMDPRQRGVFSAAWTLGYIATFARTDVESISLAAPSGPLGIMYRKTDYAQPGYDGTSGAAVYPVYHVISGLTRGAGQKLVAAESSDVAKVKCLAYRSKTGTTLWVANLTADEQTVSISGAKGAAFGTMIDEDSFSKATTDPVGFQSAYKAITDVSKLKLKAYAVAIISVNDA